MPQAPAPEIDAVEVDLEDFRLGEMAFQPERQQQFLHLALGGAGVGQEQRLGDLLGQGGATLDDVPGGHVHDGGTQQADGIDAAVMPEAAVLHRDDGGGQGGGEILQPQRLSHKVAEAGDDAAGAVLQYQAGAAPGVERGFRAG